MVEANKEHYQPENDVQAECSFDFFRFTEMLDSCGDVCGTEVTQLVQIDPKGDIPEIITSWLIEWLAEPLGLIFKEIKLRR